MVYRMHNQYSFKAVVTVLLAVVVLLNYWLSTDTDKTIMSSSGGHESNQLKQSLAQIGKKTVTTTTLKSINNTMEWIEQCKPEKVSFKPHVNVISNSMKTKDFKCVNLARLHPEVKICIHDVKEDKWVSYSIANGGFWETNNVLLFGRLLTSDPELHVIDIGANIGQYSLIAAHLGRKVLAVEARLLHVACSHDTTLSPVKWLPRQGHAGTQCCF